MTLSATLKYQQNLTYWSLYCPYLGDLYILSLPEQISEKRRLSLPYQSPSFSEESLIDMDPIHQESMTESLRDLFESSRYSDLAVRCGAKEFRLHRAIVCTRSKFFATACNGQYSESRNGIITLREDDLPTVYRMFVYLYMLDYDDSGLDVDAASIEPYNLNTSREYETAEAGLSTEQKRARNQLINNVAVYAIGEKYDIPELKHLAASKFDDALKGTDADLLSVLPALIDAVFETTPSTDTLLRNVMIKHCHAHAKALTNDDSSCQTSLQHPDFCLGLVREVIIERENNAKQAQEVAKSHETEVEILRWRLKDINRKVGSLEYAAENALEYLDEVPCSANDAFRALRRCLVQMKNGIKDAKEEARVSELSAREVEDGQEYE